MLQTMMDQPDFGTRDVLGIPVADFSRDEAIGWVLGRIARERHGAITFLNAHNANVAMRDPAFRSALDRFTILSDGVGVDIAATLLHGRPFRANLNGTDFVPDLLRRAPGPLKVALLGARPGVAQMAAEAFAHVDGRHDYRALHHGFLDADDELRVLADLASWRPDILLVAMGVPKQELWIAEKITAAHCTMAMGVGALFDFMSGVVPRAPRWLRALRGEWVYRLMREPRRLSGRYLVGNPRFLGHVLRWKISTPAR